MLKWIKINQLNKFIINFEELHIELFEEVIDKWWSKKIIDKLYENWLDATKFDLILRKIKDYFMKNKYWKLVKDLDDNTIEQIINDCSSWDNLQEVSCNEKEKTIWLFNEIINEFKEVKEWDKVEIQIMRIGKWQHPIYWEVKVDKTVIDWVLKNYNENMRWIDLVIDENHEPNHKALWWIKDLKKIWSDALFATIELTKMGADLISQWAYKYFSPELIFNKKDEETWKIIKNLLVWWAFTNRPFFKAMKPLMANEENSFTNKDYNKNILFFNTDTNMKTILDLLAKFTEWKLSLEDRKTLALKFSELTEEDKTDELTSAIKEAIKEEEEKPEVKKEEFKEIKLEDKKFDDKWEITISMSELNELKTQANLVKWLIEEKRKNDVINKVNGLSFSETNKTWLILPKSINNIVDFTLSLNEKQSNDFFEIITNLQTIETWEIWHNKDVGHKYSEDKVNWLMSKMWMSKEEAVLAATEAEEL